MMPYSEPAVADTTNSQTEVISGIVGTPLRRTPAHGGRAIDALYEVSKILSGPTQNGAILSPVLNVLASFVGLRMGTVYLLVDTPDESCEGSVNPYFVAATTGSEQPGETARDLYPPAAIETVLKTGVAFVLQNVAEHSPESEIPKYLDVREGERIALLSVPIPGHGLSRAARGVLTVLRVYGREPLTLDQDLQLLKMVATLIGQSLRFREMVMRDRERLMADSKLKSALSAAPSKPMRKAAAQATNAFGIVGDSDVIQQVLDRLSKVAPTRSTILLRGESGTGKELFARATHLMSKRRDRPFVKVNCAALSESLLESELFGHEKGAFTGATSQRKGRFELADRGTLFLDEIGEISASFQAKLLRALQEGEFERVGGAKTVRVDVRLICATNQDLEAAVSRGDFRADLYYRICVIPILLPPLRERPEDIPRLAETFLERFNSENGTALRFSGQAAEVLGSCYFPGNVRELENCVNRVASMAAGPEISPEDLACQQDACLSAQIWKPERNKAEPGRSITPVTTRLPVLNDSGPPVNCPKNNGQPPTRKTEREELIDAMERSGWVPAKAARILGLTPRQIGYALKKHKVEIKRF